MIGMRLDLFYFFKVKSSVNYTHHQAILPWETSFTNPEVAWKMWTKCAYDCDAPVSFHSFKSDVWKHFSLHHVE